MRYIAFLDGFHVDGQNLAPIDQLEYCFHCFALDDEAGYEPTGDISFDSPNEDVPNLTGGVERAINAVLHISPKATLLTVAELEQLLASSTDDELTIPGTALTRTRSDLQAIYGLALNPPLHNH